MGTNNHPNGVAALSRGCFEPNVTYTHYHPKQTPMSAADAKALNNYGPGSRMRAILPDGQVLEMAKGSTTIPINRPARRASRKSRPRSTGRWMRSSRQGWRPKPRTGSIRKQSCGKLDAEGIIEYTTPLQGLTSTEEMYIAEHSTQSKPEIAWDHGAMSELELRRMAPKDELAALELKTRKRLRQRAGSTEKPSKAS